MRKHESAPFFQYREHKEATAPFCSPKGGTNTEKFSYSVIQLFKIQNCLKVYFSYSVNSIQKPTKNKIHIHFITIPYRSRRLSSAIITAVAMEAFKDSATPP